MQILIQISKGIDRLNGWMGHLIRWLVLVMVLVGAYHAVGRYLTRYTGVSLTNNAIYDAQWYVFAIIFLLGAAYGLERDVHVRVDVLFAKLTDKGRAWIDLAGSVLFLLPFSVVMLWVSYPWVRRSWAVREVSPNPGGLVVYPIKTLLLFSFTLLLLQCISQIIKQIEILRGAPAEAVLPHTPDEPDVRHGEGV